MCEVFSARGKPLFAQLDATLTEAGLRDKLKIIIGGGPVNEKVLDFCGADAYGKDPSEAVKLANQHLG